MSEMARELYGNNPLMAGPLIAMLLFGVVFALAVYGAIRADKRHVERLSHLPLEGEIDHE
ncbi:MAG: hypothetical protein IT378_26345 [Sandaracinaceae bacterium]|nr:hypothetical protein [Sandaracinaceae bacterium]MCC6877858.1 hypothetical protein [Sandaracinaceae bacterium]